jgi:hypothetical protein
MSAGRWGQMHRWIERSSEGMTMPRSTTSKSEAARNGGGEPESTALVGEEQSVPSQPPDPENIARRAYERFQMRGGEHGRDEEDWLEAERELTVADAPNEAS